jgi:outer membrane protein OmpA-like peptidoglycan-associated protein
MRCFPILLVALICTAAHPAAGQAPLAQSGAPLSESGASPATPVMVSAAQVYLACRSDLSAPAASALRSFCNDLRLPNRLEEVLNIGKQWTGVTPPLPADIESAARDAVKPAQREGDALLQGLSPFLGGVTFGLDSAVIRPGVGVIVDSMAAGLLRELAAEPGKVFRVRGYADARLRGDTNEDAVLAYQRALALREALAQRGVPLANMVPDYQVLNRQVVLNQAQRVAPHGPGGRNADADLGLARQAAVLPEQPSAPASTGSANSSTPAISGLDPGSLALALTDALIERADRELQQFVLASAAEKICERARELLEQTCRYFEGGLNATYQPSTMTLQSTIRSDVQRLPETALMMAWRVQFAGPLAQDDEARQKALLAWYLLRTIDRVRRGEDAIEVVGGLHTWALPQIGAIQNQVKFPAVEFVQNFSRLTSILDTARVQLTQVASGVEINADTALLYSLKALAVQRPEIRTRIDQLVEAWAAVEQHTKTMRALRTSILAARDSARAKDRAVLYTEFLNTAGSLVLAAAERGLDPAQRAEFVTGFDNVRALTTAVGAGEYRVAVHRLADLLTEYDLEARPDGWNHCGVPKPAAPVAANGAAPAPPKECGQLPGLRVLSLVVDVSEAENQQALNSAFRRFVGQGGSFRRKRQGTGSYLFANAYVGLGGGFETVQLTDGEAGTSDDEPTSRYIGVSLPVGAEFGTPLGSGWSASIFVPIMISEPWPHNGLAWRKRLRMSVQTGYPSS